MDLEKLAEKLAKEEAKLVDDIAKLSARLDNPMFVERAKPEVVERERANLSEMTLRLEKVRERRHLLGDA